jgi:transcriptional regulator with XRE-family HTH domain
MYCLDEPMKITQIRKAKGITQTELADRCGTTQQQIARIENGSVDPRLSTLRRVADALGCELPDLLFTRAEFLREIREVAASQARKPANLPILELNALCSRERHIPAFHPFWEEVAVKGGKIVLTGGTSHGKHG